MYFKFNLLQTAISRIKQRDTLFYPLYSLLPQVKIRLGDRMEDVDEVEGPLTVDGIDGIIALVMHHKCCTSKVEAYLTPLTVNKHYYLQNEFQNLLWFAFQCAVY